MSRLLMLRLWLGLQALGQAMRHRGRALDVLASKQVARWRGRSR